jgi:hypothetical protein
MPRSGEEKKSSIGLDRRSEMEKWENAAASDGDSRMQRLFLVHQYRRRVVPMSAE